MDVMNKDSILEAKKVIQEKEGSLHILVNKYVSIIFPEAYELNNQKSMKVPDKLALLPPS